MTNEERLTHALNTLRYLAETSMQRERDDYGWGVVPAGIILGIIDSAVVAA